MIDERAIYELLYPKLKGKKWKHEVWLDGGFERAAATYGTEGVVELSILDMNTAFAECIPKLREEGVAVMYNNMDSHEWWLDPVGNVRDPFTNSDFYVALTEYLKEEVK